MRGQHTESPSDAATDLPTLSVVVIARNEESRIERCLDSAVAATEAFDAELLVVDSNSTDRTVDIATEYPATVLRIPDDGLSTPGAGRYVGTQYAAGEQVLFVDADMVVAETDWLETAARMIATTPDLAGVDGRIAGVDSRLGDETETGVEPVESLRGIALYDADALGDVDGFDPFLRAMEDIHLGFELTAAGYELRRLPTVVGEQVREESDLREPLRRWNRGFFYGVADVFARSASSPRLLARHLWKFRAPAIVAAWLLAGVASLVALPAFGAWVGTSVVGVLALVRVKGPELAYKLLSNWLLVLLALLVHDWSTPPERDDYPLDRVEVVASGPSVG